VGASALVTIASPFGTSAFDIGPRFLYWFGMISVGCVQWLLIVRTIHRLTSIDPWPPIVCVIVSSTVFAGLMALEVNLVRGWLSVAPTHTGVGPFFGLLGGMLVFCLFGQLLVRFIAATATEPPQDAGGEVRFLKRIPNGIAGDLLSLRTEDHYLRIHTTQGSDLILFRLKDALAELDGADGMQVHRSYWIARDAIEAIERKGRKTILVLKNGQHVPVSESFMPAVRDAGWLD
jgi:hypothetical protein